MDGSAKNSAPPAYTATPEDELVTQTAKLALSDLDIATELPNIEKVIAHLELLHAIHTLRNEVSNQDGLFDLRDQDVEPEKAASNNSSRTPLLEYLRAKRWAVYVARAEDRFRVWWSSLRKRKNATMLRMVAAASKDCVESLIESRSFKKVVMMKDDLPPLDVLMVWHAFMLNPKCYLEDCLRFGMMDMWHNSMPWSAIHESINFNNGSYQPGEHAIIAFESLTSLNWVNTRDPAEKLILCPAEFKDGVVRFVQAPWTTCGLAITSSAGSLGTSGLNELPSGDGYADRDFEVMCPSCQLMINHEMLRAAKFMRDTGIIGEAGFVTCGDLQAIPLPGTVIPSDRVTLKKKREPNTPELLPNFLIKAAMGRPSWPTWCTSMNDVRDFIETAVKDRHLMKEARGGRARGARNERIAIRRFMSRYWENSSPFALDLVGAVIRQGSFVEKMYNIDWLHSPALSSTVARLIEKYTRFFNILATHPLKLIVPTLDVDLAWHTHQLSPRDYYKYSMKQTTRFIDHDDKIADTKLSDAFGETSRIYQKIYKEPYSCCTCWYCEAVRASSHGSKMSRLFDHSTVTAVEQQLYDPCNRVNSDPALGPHISTHSAIHPTDVRRPSLDLDKALKKASRRAEKNGRESPGRSTTQNDVAVIFPCAYGYYGAPIYVGNPGCANFTPGAAGNCASGTCGGGVAAGACGGGGAGCAGGAAGGGGGFGGCGGGGGGGGCGGGGGGGCGGGGGGG